MSNLNEQRAQYFTHHPTAAQFYFTIDDMAFDHEDNAISHANHLKMQQGKAYVVDTVTRSDFEAWEKQVGGKAAIPTYNKLKKEELQAICIERGISFEADANKAALITLLEADDANNATADTADVAG